LRLPRDLPECEEIAADPPARRTRRQPAARPAA
jgi:hypothetical protein